MTETADDFFALSMRAAQAGDAANWEANLRKCIALAPNHALALLNLGRLLAERRAYAEAEELLRRSLAAQPMVENLTALAEVFEATDRPAKAEGRYQTILGAVPGHAGTLKRLGSLNERTGNIEAAAAYYKQAWEADPKDFQAAIGYAVATVDRDPAATAATMDRLLRDNAQDDDARLKILHKLLLYKEFHERTKRGLMPHHATSVSELFYTYCADDFSLFYDLSLKAAAAQPNDPNTALGKFIALFCARDRVAAETCLSQLRPYLANHPLRMVTFAPAFYRQLESQSDEAIIAGLPPVIDVTPATFTGTHITYLSCNFQYFADFAVPLLRSFADRTPGGQVHVHIMDGTDEQLRAVTAVCADLSGVTTAVSTERPGVDKQGPLVARAYYHSVRFIRFYQHLKRYGRTLWMMDVDALFNRNANEMYGAIGDRDAAFRIRAGRMEPWNQFSAAIIGATGNPASLAYFRLIAAYLAQFHRKGELQWGIDQSAMYGAYMHLKDERREPEVAFLDNRVMDQDYTPEGIVWFTAGKKKYARPGADGNVSLSKRDAARMKYWELFDKFSVGKGPA
jgi:tetratricopeptide (TPR) repeat protein